MSADEESGSSSEESSSEESGSEESSSESESESGSEEENVEKMEEDSLPRRDERSAHKSSSRAVEGGRERDKPEEHRSSKSTSSSKVRTSGFYIFNLHLSLSFSTIYFLFCLIHCGFCAWC